ncbi:MAG: hypothetical protein OEZ39_04435 [Gammaproteobacteria bacterium]|nr:hypothetical protein [Gammaproteobacteria bacterium]MDH5651106.1 hypothetical protein [Gammaproteobacteria bacterium]
MSKRTPPIPPSSDEIKIDHNKGYNPPQYEKVRPTPPPPPPPPKKKDN